MASVPVTLDGLLYDLLNKTTQRVVLIGEASLTGLTVGGGPVIPPSPVEPPKPPGIWGPTDPRPTPPINFPPGWVGGIPPILQPPEGFPNPPEGGVKPPPPEGGWGYSPDYGWGYFPGGGGKPQPLP